MAGRSSLRLHACVCVCVCTFLSATSSMASASPAWDFFGTVLADWDESSYSSPTTPIALQQIKAKTGMRDVSIVQTYYQSDINSTSISPWPGKTPSNSSVEAALVSAFAAGLDVTVKPHVDLRSDPSHWRGEIGTHFDDDQAGEWFASYSSFLSSSLSLLCSAAAKTGGTPKGVAVGTELSMMERWPQLWRALISDLRAQWAECEREMELSGRRGREGGGE
mmetsp:Transcript_34813/g.90265  ORF Transcript_34813/g.90265 Transcript_34813/m.90265 type:complete len:221 (-) Transcript_34813:92-754(-)